MTDEEEVLLCIQFRSAESSIYVSIYLFSFLFNRLSREKIGDDQWAVINDQDHNFKKTPVENLETATGAENLES